MPGMRSVAHYCLIVAGTLKDGSDIKRRLKEQIMVMLTKDVPSNELNLGTEKPAVSLMLVVMFLFPYLILLGYAIDLSLLLHLQSMMIVGVNGSGKTTTIGKLSYKFKQEGLSVLLAAGDTFRAAAGEQLEGWAARSECEVVRDDSKTVAEVLYMAGGKAKEEQVLLGMPLSLHSRWAQYGLLDCMNVNAPIG